MILKKIKICSKNKCNHCKKNGSTVKNIYIIKVINDDQINAFIPNCYVTK